MPHYIWERKNWTDFPYNADEVLPALSVLRKKQGYFLRHIDELGFENELHAYARIVEEDALKTSAIEGVTLDREGVRSSIARHLGLERAGLREASYEANGLVTVLLDAVHNYGQPLTKKCLCTWHTLLFPAENTWSSKIAVGVYRKTQMQVISGRYGNPKVHFEAPDPKDVQKQMQAFFQWWKKTQNSMDGIIRAALVHLYFVTIHPFENGNGRLARVISDIALAQDEGMTRRFYSVSAQIMLERSCYYELLEKTQKGDGDCTKWLVWFIECLGRAIDSGTQTIGTVLDKADFWRKFAAVTINERQKKVLNRLLDAGKDGFTGGLTTQKYMGMTKTSRATAFRDIEYLVQNNMLRPLAKGGRSTAYELVL